MKKFRIVSLLVLVAMASVGCNKKLPTSDAPHQIDAASNTREPIQHPPIPTATN